MQGPKKAYKNKRFLSSIAARPIRILSEFLEPESRFNKFKIENAIVFFGSARLQNRETILSEIQELENQGDKSKLKLLKKQLEYSRYYDDASELAKRLTAWTKSTWPACHEFPIMTGGGPGIMEAANRGASSVPKSVNIGLNISLPFEQSSNPYITRQLNFEFHYFFTRKFWFLNMARVLVVFPGGFGTLDELFELLTLVQTGKVRKRIAIVLFGNEYWKNVVNFDFLVSHGFIKEEDLQLFKRFDQVDDAFQYLQEFLLTLKPNP